MIVLNSINICTIRLVTLKRVNDRFIELSNLLLIQKAGLLKVIVIGTIYILDPDFVW